MNMKKILLLTLPLMVMCFASCEKNKGTEAGGVTEDGIIVFKDQNFLKALLSVQWEEIYDEETGEWTETAFYIDENNDGQISVDEAKNIKSVNLYNYEEDTGYGITDIGEIKFFTSLENLICYGNKLTALNISNNNALKYLDCSDNNISSITFPSNNNLIDIDCSYNPLKTLCLSNCRQLNYLSCGDCGLVSLSVDSPSLESLYCEDNYISTLELKSNTALRTLYCQNNLLKSLNFDGNPEFEHLECDNNQLQSLDFPNNPALRVVRCGYNQINNIDITENPNVIDLRAENNLLTSLDLSNQKTITDNTTLVVYLRNNPLQTLYFADTEDGRELARRVLNNVTSTPTVIYK